MKAIRNALDKSEKKLFGDMWDIPILYASACSNSCQLVPLPPIIISILFHHYKEPKECILQVEQLEAKVNSSNKKVVGEHVSVSRYPNMAEELILKASLYNMFISMKM